ncbi:hypothetical protein KO525_15680 [Psychrosphaera sp. B3R10]|uniref:hypothetical protein n=1 Tax=unclassified Psychrosphaera TaxID=2641570 RepID=UPI001C08BAAC|nr:MULTISPECIES: hypothetical protein [unclassified Psychrosphaera]MBU2880949.1 hypothetical protein [Psychrosphaera sp. I2R16]MBU2990832.1 hypothetical protein [Psychrosphaera sp. B3R10]
MNLKQLALQPQQLAHAHIIEGADLPKVVESCLQFTALMLCSKRPLSSDTPCGQCQSCKLFAANNHPDLLSIGQEGLSVGVDEVRSIATFFSQKPHIAGRQIVLIYNADKMTESAANAVLKTLEEPTDNSFILLMSENRHNQVATILSRCQVWAIDIDQNTDLKVKFSDIPDYVVGYAAGVESKLERWREDGDIEHFTAMYQTFIRWLKGQATADEFVEVSGKHAELNTFLLYLIERRIRQLMLKNVGQKAIDGHTKLTQYRLSRKEFHNLGAQVALITFIQELEYLIR